MKIGLCLSGGIGTLNKYNIGEKINPEISFYHYKKNIMNNNNIDVYCHSWDSGKYGTLINELYKPINFLHENQNYFGHDDDFIQKYGMMFGLQSRLNSIKKSLNMLLSYEKENNIKYDFIMISRYDIVFLNKINFTNLKKNIFYSSHWNDRTKTNNHKFGLYDSFFIANSNIFHKLITSDLYNKICNIKDDSVIYNSHVAWLQMITEIDIPIYYKYFVGKDYELTRRHYYNGDGRITYGYSNIKQNWDKYYNYYKK